MTDDAAAAARTALAGGPLTHRYIADADQAGNLFRSLVSRLEPSSSDTVRTLPLATAIAERLFLSADPYMALLNFDRFVQASPDAAVVRQAIKRSPANLHALVVLFAGSQFLSDVLISQPTSLTWLLSHENLGQARGPGYFAREAQATVEPHAERAGQRAALSLWRRLELLRIGLRDLLQAALAEEIVREISDLAEAIIAVASRLVYAELAVRYGVPIPENPATLADPANAQGGGMCILGMGKLGGRELNFSSDIDLIFIYDSEGETAGRDDAGRRVAVITNHAFFTKMGEGIVKFLADRGPEGNLFRVDMRLRPEGQHGPLARSLEAFVYYLNTQARDWERLAYLKARILSGPSQLSEQLYRVISDFVFAGLDPRRIVGEIQELKVRIDREVATGDLYYREVKRGYGGIREIEFVVAAMQIIHGNTHHALRVRNSFLSVQRLYEVGILTQEEATFYHDAYTFLRMVEHRLQMAQEHQTHTLPLPGAEYEAIARRCGFKDGAEFQQEYARITNAVHQRFTEFFQLDTGAVEQASRDALIILDRDADPAEALEAMQRRGIGDPQALRLVHALAYGTREVFVSAEGQRFFEQMLNSLLRMTASAPMPEQVLPQFHNFALAIKGITYYYEVIAQHPDILKLLVLLFGTSEPLSQSLIAHPEFFDQLISSRLLNDPNPPARAMRERMQTALAVRTPKRRVILLRRAASFERLVTGLRFLLRIRPLQQCLATLSEAADIALDIAIILASHRMAERIEKSEKPSADLVVNISEILQKHFSILALGKYGGHELNFFGDLDVVFVWTTPDGATYDGVGGGMSPAEFFNAAADSVMHIMSEPGQGGRVFAMDARLRPHGRGAPLAVNLDAYVAYLKTEAETWELQALHRSRCAWGDCGVLSTLRKTVRSRLASSNVEVIQGEIKAMRLRLEENATSHDGALDVKRSAGGIVDVEFYVQAIAMERPMLWTDAAANYFTALDMLDRTGDMGALKANYTFLRKVENTWRLISGGTDSAIPLEGAKAEALARSLDFPGVAEFASRIAETQRAIREETGDVIA